MRGAKNLAVKPVVLTLVLRVLACAVEAKTWGVRK